MATNKNYLFNYLGTDPSYPTGKDIPVTIIGKTDERKEGLVDDEEETVKDLYRIRLTDGSELLAYPYELTPCQ